MCGKLLIELLPLVKVQGGKKILRFTIGKSLRVDDFLNIKGTMKTTKDT